MTKVWFCPWDGFPMDRPLRNCDANRCKQCQRWIDGWYPPLTASYLQLEVNAIHLNWRGIPLCVYHEYEDPKTHLLSSEPQTDNDSVYLRVELDFSPSKVLPD